MDPFDMVRAFLGAELTRKEDHECIGIDLLYAANNVFCDEPLRRWSRNDDPDLFNSVTKLVDKIAEGVEAVVANCFVVRVRQRQGGRATLGFSWPRHRNPVVHGPS